MTKRNKLDILNTDKREELIRMLEVGKFVRGNNGSKNWIGQIVGIDMLAYEYRVRDARTGLYFYVSCGAVCECARPCI